MRLFAVGFLLLFVGCGTVLKGKYMTVPINTTPSEALVKVPDMLDNEPTPTSVRIERGQSYLVEINKPGFKEKWVVLQKRKHRSIIFANILFTAGVGILVDWYTGRWYGVTPSKVEIFLDPVSHFEDGTIVPLQLTDSTMEIQDESVRIKVYEIENENAEKRLIYPVSE